MVIWRGWWGTLKRVVWYFEGGYVVTCKYADIGCMVTLSRKLMLEHEADLLEHFSCMHVRIYCYSRRLALKNRNVVIIFFQKYVAFANMRIALLEVFYASCYVNCCIWKFGVSSIIVVYRIVFRTYNSYDAWKPRNISKYAAIVAD